MKTDITLRVTAKLQQDAEQNLKKASSGHIGTHFDCMNKQFPLENTERRGVVFDVSGIQGRDIEISDVDMSRLKKGTFVIFYSGYVEQEGYGSKKYFSCHPQVSNELIDALLDEQVSMIGCDFSGLRNGSEHTACDQRCADRGVFIVENLCNLKSLVGKDDLLIHTYPMNFANWTGLPCRVIAETTD